MRTWVIVTLLVLVAASSGTARAQEYYPKDTETYLINYQVMAKDPATATMLSLAPGFGFGHFYAGDVVRGVVMAAGELVGVLLILVAPKVGEPGDAAQDVLLYAGLSLFGGFKLADVYLASDSVEQHNKNVARGLKIKPLISSTSGPPIGRGGRSVVYGLGLTYPFGG